jgi:hypothetical protein
MRCLTIGEGIRVRKHNQRTYYPQIRLEGVWLEDAGFLPGSVVYLFVESGKIVLKSKPENETEAKAIKLINALDDVAA